VDENESIQSALAGVVVLLTRRDMRVEFDLEALEKGVVRITEEMALMDIVDEICFECDVTMEKVSLLSMKMLILLTPM